MTDDIQSVRDDLAFMRALVHDKDPLPATFGGHLLAPGLLFGVFTLPVWGILTNRLPLDAAWLHWLWLPAAILYLPVFIWLLRQGRADTWGPSKRLFISVWSAVGTMGGVTLACLIIATFKIGGYFMLLWPPLAFMLWGGGWMAVSIARRETWCKWLAWGCFATAALAAWLIRLPEQWLVMALGMIVWIAGPGLLIILRARRRDA